VKELANMVNELRDELAALRKEQMEEKERRSGLFGGILRKKSDNQLPLTQI
jgi:hypothetical protein